MSAQWLSFLLHILGSMITWISSVRQGERPDIIATHGRLKKPEVLPSAPNLCESSALIKGLRLRFLVFIIRES